METMSLSIFFGKASTAATTTGKTLSVSVTILGDFSAIILSPVFDNSYHIERPEFGITRQYQSGV